MLDNESFQSFFFYVLGDKLIKVAVEFVVIENTELLGCRAVRVFTTTVTGKASICIFSCVLKSSDETRQFAIVVDEVFSDCFERPQSQ